MASKLIPSDCIRVHESAHAFQVGELIRPANSSLAAMRLMGNVPQFWGLPLPYFGRSGRAYWTLLDGLYQVSECLETLIWHVRHAQHSEDVRHVKNVVVDNG